MYSNSHYDIAAKEIGHNQLNDDFDDSLSKGCRMFWRAIIAQSIMDAMSNYKRTELKIAKSSAIHWFTGDSDGFIAVCNLAGYRPSVVREKVLKLTGADSNLDC